MSSNPIFPYSSSIYISYIEAEVSLFEGLSATGLRSARYALEVPGIQKIVANDISEDAYHLIQKNIDHNKVGHIVTASHQDAS